jgi:hypothetical protein
MAASTPMRREQPDGDPIDPGSVMLTALSIMHAGFTLAG